MKIVHVETGRHFYGGAQQVVWLMAGLAEEGVDGILVCLPNSELNAAARDAGVTVVNIACSGDHDLRFAWRLRRYLKDSKPDLVHCHSRRGADFLGGLAASLAGRPAVISRRVDSKDSRFVARHRYQHFKRIVAISDHIAALLKAHATIADRVVTIRSAVDTGSLGKPTDCVEIRKSLGVGEDDFAIAVVAQLITRKGHRFLFDVVPNLRDLHPDLRVVLFGRGKDEEALKALATHMNLFGTVQFAGFRKDLDELLGCFDLLVHPATEEGLGVAMLKAASAGLPVVAFNTAGAKEAVVHGKTGVLVAPRDVRALQKAISLLIEEPQMCRDLGEDGRQRMREEFSIRQMVERHIDMYKSVQNGDN